MWIYLIENVKNNKVYVGCTAFEPLERWNQPGPTLAKQYGVHKSTIYRIKGTNG